ncbi:high mobility group box domain-containing protein [Fennellomyces sp. T-0311]|nr:high mobility group box domain-containing protein [Fennellomyces sp. T-0311]
MFINQFKNSYSCSLPEQTCTPPHPINQLHCQANVICGDRKVPRPQNAFMLYLQAVRPGILSNNPSLHNKEVSRIAGELWRKESEKIQKHFERRADEEKLYHSFANPGYKYRPQQRRKACSNRKAEQHVGQNKPCRTVENPIEKTLADDSQELLANSPPSQCLDATILQAFFDHSTYVWYHSDGYL